MLEEHFLTRFGRAMTRRDNGTEKESTSVFLLATSRHRVITIIVCDRAEDCINLMASIVHDVNASNGQ